MEVYNAMTRLVDSYGDPTDLKQFRKFIQNFLAFTVEKDNDPRREMTTPENMRLWINAFTHDTYDAQNNYEELEFLGDAEMKTAFKSYLYHSHHVSSPHIFTSLNNYYLSEKYQPYMAKVLNLEPWIRIHQDVNITDKILEDVLEACFGALVSISRKLYFQDRGKYLYPQELIVRFFTVFFTGNEMDLTRGNYVFKTQLLLYFKFFANVLKDPFFDRQRNRFILTEDFFNGIVEKAPNIELGRQVVRDIKRIDLDSLVAEKMSTTQDNQAEAIVRIFLAAGMTPEWREDYGRNFSFKGDEEIDRIAKANGFTRFIIEAYYTSDKIRKYKLLAQSSDEKRLKTKSELVYLFPDVPNIKAQARKMIIDTYGRKK